VGLGQALAVDPTDGTVIIQAHSQGKIGMHVILTADPARGYNCTYVATLGGEITVDGMGISSAYDHDQKVFYTGIGKKDGYQSTGAAYFAVDMAYPPASTTGSRVHQLDDSLMMSHLSYDSATQRVYGTAVQMFKGRFMYVAAPPTTCLRVCAATNYVAAPLTTCLRRY